MKSSIVNRQSSIINRSIALCLLSSVLCLLALGGCDAVANVSPDRVKAFAADVNEVNDRVDIYQAVGTAAIERLRDQKQIDPNLAERVLSANADIDRLQSVIASITASLQGAEFSGGEGIISLLEAAQSANAASAPWNPYAAPIGAALTILLTILGAYAKKKSAEASALAAKYKAHKQGVEKTMKLASASNVEEVKKFEAVLYDNIGQARANLGVK